MEELYDFAKRTLRFSKLILDISSKVPFSIENKLIVRQLIRSACSIGANYRESREGYSGADMKAKLSIARKECRETTYWLELLLYLNAMKTSEICVLIDESVQLSKILYTIMKKMA